MPKKVIADNLPEFFWKQNPTFHIRLTSPNLTMEKTQQMLTDFDLYIVSSEGDGEQVSRHQHICVSHPSLDRKVLRESVSKVYPKLKGNKEISITIAKNSEQLSRYVVKDGDFTYKGFTQHQIERFCKLSYDVKKTKKKFTQIMELYKLGQIDIQEYAERYIQIKCESNQPLYTNHFRAHLRMMKFSRDKSLVTHYCENILRDIEYN